MKRLLCCLILFLLCAAAFADAPESSDWPQYLGPDRNSTSRRQGLLRSWPEDGPEVLWTVEVGRGYGGPVVKDGKVYLLDRDDEVGDNDFAASISPMARNSGPTLMTLPDRSCFLVHEAYRPLTGSRLFVRP